MLDWTSYIWNNSGSAKRVKLFYVKALYRVICKTEEPNSGNKGETNFDKYLITASLLVGMFTIIMFFQMVYTACPEEKNMKL